jgi:TRAP-type C4-dicarboxylate transport system permease small subunit
VGLILNPEAGRGAGMDNGDGNVCVGVIDQLSRYTGIIGGVFLFVIVIAITADFVAVTFYTLPLRFNADLLSLLGIYMILLPAAMALKEDKQVQVSLLFNKFPPMVQKIITLTSLLMALIVFAITAYNGYNLALEGFHGGLKSNSPYGMKLWYSQSAVAIGIAILCLQVIAKVLSEIRRKV